MPTQCTVRKRHRTDIHKAALTQLKLSLPLSQRVNCKTRNVKSTKKLTELHHRREPNIHTPPITGILGCFYRGSYMSAHVLLNLLNELGKRDKMRGLPSILSLFRNEFNKFNNTRARMLDSIYHMANTLKSHFWRKNVIILSLCTQRCHGRHNVSRKSINH